MYRSSTLRFLRSGGHRQKAAHDALDRFSWLALLRRLPAAPGGENEW